MLPDRKKMIFPSAEPNFAHKFIANLDKTKNVTVVTQNIDGLHTKAGSKNVLELHGSVYRNYCEDCHYFYSLDEIMSGAVPYCKKCGGIIKPDVVLYEEPLDESIVYRAVNAIKNADMIVIIGTSLTVYPAAAYIDFYKGNKMVLINKQATNHDLRADLVFNEDIVSVFKRCNSEAE